jgi:hypothetical protein
LKMNVLILKLCWIWIYCFKIFCWT